MPGRNKKTKHAKQKVLQNPREKSKLENKKEEQSDKPKRRKQRELLKDKQEDSGAHVVGTVLGLILGTMMGSLVWPMMMMMYGPIIGITIGAGVAGGSGVIIQNVLSKNVELLKIVLPLFAIILMPSLFYIVFGTSTLEYIRENLNSGRVVSLE